MLKNLNFCPVCLSEIKDYEVHKLTCNPEQDLSDVKLKCKAEGCNKYYSFCEEHWKNNWNKLKRRQGQLFDEEIAICISKY